LAILLLSAGETVPSDRLIDELWRGALARSRGARRVYRCGRQADALAVDLYRSTRRALVEQLGIEPSRPLRELEQTILRQAAGDLDITT
jgi:hypothetical protein